MTGAQAASLACVAISTKGFASKFKRFDCNRTIFALSRSLQAGPLALQSNMKIMKKIIFAKLFILIFAFALFAQTAPQEKSVTIFGAKIRYLEAGDAAKPTVILLHGLGAQAETWQFNIPALAANYHVIAPDQVGFGKSDKPFLKYRVGTYADFLDKFMSELKIEKAHLVGNSMGGWVAGLMAIKYPNRVEKIVLADAAGLVAEGN